MSLLRISTEGERVRRAAGMLEADGEMLAGAIRRSAPFLSKPAYKLDFVSAVPALFSETLEKVRGPSFVAHFDVDPGGSTGALLLDADAIAILVDAMLGGDGVDVAPLEGMHLSTSQNTLLNRVSAAVLGQLSHTLGQKGAISLKPRKEAPSSTVEGGYVMTTWSIATQTRSGRIVLALARDAAVTRVRFDPRPAAGGQPDDRVVAALRRVELALVVELGRTRMPLREISRLRIGATLFVDTTVDSPVCVRVDGHVVMTGDPTTDNGRIAVRVRTVGQGSNVGLAAVWRHEG